LQELLCTIYRPGRRNANRSAKSGVFPAALPAHKAFPAADSEAGPALLLLRGGFSSLWKELRTGLESRRGAGGIIFPARSPSQLQKGVQSPQR